MSIDAIPTRRRLRQRWVSLTEEADEELAEMSRSTGKPASAIVRAAIARLLAEWRAKKGRP